MSQYESEQIKDLLNQISKLDNRIRGLKVDKECLEVDLKNAYETIEKLTNANEHLKSLIYSKDVA